MSIGQKPHGPLRSYGRIKARQLKTRQAGLIEANLPRLSIPDPALGPIDPEVLAPGFDEVWLEIGFGAGEHMAAQAQRHPQVLILGAEPFLNGAASAVRHIDERGIDNIRILQGDGRALAAALPEACLSRIFILFPDPWPKSRHHKRRLLQPPFCSLIASRIRPGGYFHSATDWEEYAQQMLEVLSAEAQLENTAAAYAERPGSRPLTKFEQRGLRLGHRVWDLIFRRK